MSKNDRMVIDELANIKIKIKIKIILRIKRSSLIEAPTICKQEFVLT